MVKPIKNVHWIKWQTKETIYGSFMTEPVNSLGFMVKVCCLSAETRYPGFIQSEPNRGIAHIQIAALLNIPIVEFEELLDLQKKDKRLLEYDNGVIEIVNWGKYQAIPKWNGSKPIEIDDGKSGEKKWFGKYEGIVGKGEGKDGEGEPAESE